MIWIGAAATMLKACILLHVMPAVSTAAAASLQCLVRAVACDKFVTSCVYQESLIAAEQMARRSTNIEQSCVCISASCIHVQVLRHVLFKHQLISMCCAVMPQH